jgi:hypothetical protein
LAEPHVEGVTNEPVSSRCGCYRSAPAGNKDHHDMPPSLDLDRHSSRHCAATFGFVDACVRAVAAGADLERVLPGYSARDIAAVAADILESRQVLGALSADDLNGEVRAGDWTLAVLAELRFEQAEEHRKAGRASEREAAEAAAYAAWNAIAASPSRTPLLWYEDIYFETARALAKRGDRLALIHQARCIQDCLQRGEEGNSESALRDFAFHCLDLGEHSRGFGLLAALLLDDPANIWTYNVIALGSECVGYGATARIAAERGLQLLAKKGDPDGLRSQLKKLAVQYMAATDRDDAGLALWKAMSIDFASGQGRPLAELARELIPELELVQPKERPNMPEPAELERIAAGLRTVFGDEIANSQSWGQRLHGPHAPIASPKPPVGRNEPCPCGTGKKYKKCCGNPAKR